MTETTLFPRSAGILLHPTSLPGPYGIGDLGDAAYRFVDWLESAGQSIWQILPLGPTSYGDSPYQTLSAFAGNPNLGLARMHLNAQDQVGLLLTGHGRRWIPPRLGTNHLITLTDALLELSTHEWADRQHRRQRLDRLVPLDAVVIAVSPLLNEAFSELLKPLLARGQQVDVIEPTYRLPADLQLSSRDNNGDPTLAWRVFEIEQHLRRRALMAMGASVSPWSSDEPIESTLLRLRRAQRAKLATVRAARPAQRGP
jgi:hypothetical protein